MKSEPISSYIYFGTCVRYLQDVEEGWKVEGGGFVLDNINKFFMCLDKFNLPVTKRASYKLVEFKENLTQINSSNESPEGSTDDTDEDADSEHLLSFEEANNLRQIMSDVRKTLDAETSGNVAYIVTDKRIDVNKLLSNIPALMSDGVFDSLPIIAQYDFNDAGKCIAFEIPTAAAFYLLRGTEAVLREYYCHIIKRKRVKQLLWGPMIIHLRARKSPPLPSKTLLNHLDNIRHSFRNPTQHPDKIYDIQEVQDLFSLCIDVVNRMMKKINE